MVTDIIVCLSLVFLLASQAFGQAESLQDLSRAAQPLPRATIYTAKEILTLDPARPTANAVAVVGDRILAVGTLDDLQNAARDQPFAVDQRFDGLVIVPGFIAQHDHPFLAALTMESEIISIEDWVLPSGTVKAAQDHEEYVARLTAADPPLLG